MSQIIEITVFSYQELNEDAKATARDWFRDGALGDEWWEAVFDDFEAACGCLGVTVGMPRWQP